MRIKRKRGVDPSVVVVVVAWLHIFVYIKTILFKYKYVEHTFLFIQNEWTDFFVLYIFMNVG